MSEQSASQVRVTSWTGAKRHAVLQTLSAPLVPLALERVFVRSLSLSCSTSTCVELSAQRLHDLWPAFFPLLLVPAVFFFFLKTDQGRKLMGNGAGVWRFHIPFLVSPLSAKKSTERALQCAFV